MKTFYLFEIEANGKPIFLIGEWENLSNVTHERTRSTGDVIAYGEVEEGKYSELYDRSGDDQ